MPRLLVLYWLGKFSWRDSYFPRYAGIIPFHYAFALIDVMTMGLEIYVEGLHISVGPILSPLPFASLMDWTLCGRYLVSITTRSNLFIEQYWYNVHGGPSECMAQIRDNLVPYLGPLLIIK